ncbi:hypothetical protein WJ968_02465 [Achromobacter xylosoxidans]
MARSIFRLGGIWGLLRRLNRGEAVLSERAVAQSAWPLYRFLGSMRQRIATVRQSSIEIALNAARTQFQAGRCSALAQEQARAAGALAASGAQIAGLSASTSTHAREIAEVSGQNLQA